MSDLRIDQESLKRVDLFTVHGRVNSANYSQLEAALAAARSNVALNLANVTYMSSAGIRVMVSQLRECKKQGGDLRLSQLSSQVKEVLELTGLASLFTSYDDDTAAVGSF